MPSNASRQGGTAARRDLLAAIPELVQKLTPEQIPHAVALMVALSPGHIAVRQRIIMHVSVMSGLLVVGSVVWPLAMHDAPMWPSLLGALMGGGFLATCLSMLDGQRGSTTAFTELATSIATVLSMRPPSPATVPNNSEWSQPEVKAS
jgi:hypothetical protein